MLEIACNPEPEVLPPPSLAERDSERAHWLALSLVEGLGPRSILRLAARFGSAREAWNRGCEVLSGRVRRNLQQIRDRSDPQTLLRQAVSRGFRLLAPGDPGYPKRLLDLEDPPPVLWTRGTLYPRPREAVVAVVGSREATPYGVTLAYRIGRDLAAAGIPVASGLDPGIHSSAHLGSLAGGGPSLAVLPCGLECDYPEGYAALRRDIAGHGLLLSEYAPETPPEPWRFPARNRLLLGLCSALVVVEAAEKGPALAAARAAADLGRLVMAVPGPAGVPQSAGTLQLIRDGAHPVRDVHDILGELKRAGVPRRAPDSLTARRILEEAARGATPAAVSQATGLAPEVVFSWLLRLEIEGLVRRLPDGAYVATV